MKRLLALCLALLTLSAFTACANEDGDAENNNDAYKKEDVIITHVTDANGDTFHFVNINSDTVAITKFESTNDAPHEVKIPAYIEGKCVVRIDEEAFASVSNISKIIFPTQEDFLAENEKFAMGSFAMEIRPYAFRNCDGLIEIEFPAYITSIGDAAFYECRKLAKITFAADSKLKEIAYSSFAECSSLIAITIPASVETVSKGAFLNCIGLKTVILSEGILKVEDQAFQACKTLVAVQLPTTLAELGESVFSGASDALVINYRGENETVKAYLAENHMWTAPSDAE